MGTSDDLDLSGGIQFKASTNIAGWVTELGHEGQLAFRGEGAGPDIDVPVEVTCAAGIVQRDLDPLGELGQVEPEMLAIGGKHRSHHAGKDPAGLALLVQPGDAGGPDALVLLAPDQPRLAKRLGLCQPHDLGAFGVSEHFGPDKRRQHQSGTSDIVSRSTRPMIENSLLGYRTCILVNSVP